MKKLIRKQGLPSALKFLKQNSEQVEANEKLTDADAKHLLFRWLDAFPPKLTKAVHQLLVKNDHLAKENVQLKKQIATLKLDNANLTKTKIWQQKQLTTLREELDTYEQTVVETQVSDKQLWQAWHKFIDRKVTGYRLPLDSGHIEEHYICYISNLEWLNEFRQNLLSELAKQHLTDPRIADQEQFNEHMKALSFMKL